MKIEAIVATEVVVPSLPGTINSPALDRPLHKLDAGARPARTQQFDELPKLLLSVHWDNGVVGLGECYRDHDWDRVAAIARALLGVALSDLRLQALPIARCREHDGFECALWDSFAKRHQLRLVDLLGGPVRDAVMVGAWSGHRLPDEVAEIACRHAEQGFTCIKFKCDLDDDVVAWCEEVARAAPGMKVILDPNERWTHPFEYHEHGQRVEDAISEVHQRAVDGFNFNAALARLVRSLDEAAAP